MSTMWLTLPDGRRVDLPPFSKSWFGMEQFMKIARQPGVTLSIIDMEASSSDMLKRLQASIGKLPPGLEALDEPIPLPAHMTEIPFALKPTAFR